MYDMILLKKIGLVTFWSVVEMNMSKSQPLGCGFKPSSLRPFKIFMKNID